MDKDVRILLVGSHAPLMGSIKAQLGKEPRFSISGIAQTAEGAIAVLADQPADLVLMDIDLAGDGHFEVAQEIRTVSPSIHVVFFGDDLQDAVIEKALAIGARGFLLKHDLPGTILTAIHEVLDGGSWFPKDVRSRIIVDANGVRLAPSDGDDMETRCRGSEERQTGLNGST